MRAERWKTLFKERGWWQGEQILAPKGKSLTVSFGHNTGCHFQLPQPRQIVKADEYFLTVVREMPEGPWENVYLWEDVSGVDCIPKNTG